MSVQVRYIGEKPMRFFIRDKKIELIPDQIYTLPQSVVDKVRDKKDIRNIFEPLKKDWQISDDSLDDKLRIYKDMAAQIFAGINDKLTNIETHVAEVETQVSNIIDDIDGMEAQLVNIENTLQAIKDFIGME